MTAVVRGFSSSGYRLLVASRVFAIAAKGDGWHRWLKEHLASKRAQKNNRVCDIHTWMAAPNNAPFESWVRGSFEH